MTLPSPTNRQNATTVIFDGECRFCRGQVERLNRWDKRGQLAFISLHDEFVRERWPELSHDQLMKEMHVVDPAGTKYAGANSFRYLTRLIPLLWPLAPLMHIPFSLPIWSFFYRQIATQRYRWGRVPPCENGTCHIHFGK